MNQAKSAIMAQLGPIAIATLVVVMGLLPSSALLQSTRPPFRGAPTFAVADGSIAERRASADPLQGLPEVVKDRATKAPTLSSIIERRADPSRPCDVFVVVTDSAPYPESEERRRRDRVAVHLGMWTAGLQARDPERVRFARLDGAAGGPAAAPGTAAAAPASVAACCTEWFEARSIPGSDAHPPVPVLVAWIGNHSIGSDTLAARLEAVAREASKARRLTVVGPPYSSDLVDLLSAASRGGRAPDGARPPWLIRPDADAWYCPAATIPRSELRRFGPELVSLVRRDRTPTDDCLLQAMRRELALRVPPMVPPTAQPLVVLLHEIDTDYVRSLERLAGRNLGTAPKGERSFRVVSIPFLRGLDGSAPGAPVQGAAGTRSSAGPSNANDAMQALQSYSRNVVGGDPAIGDVRSDYIRRLAQLLDEEHGSAGQTPVFAIGLLGTDLYDKLMLLQGLRLRFPGTIFFTFELDARLREPESIPWTRNLIVASTGGLVPRARGAEQISLRDDAQRALFEAIYDAVTGRESGPAPVAATSVGEPEALDAAGPPRAFAPARAPAAPRALASAGAPSAPSADAEPEPEPAPATVNAATASSAAAAEPVNAGDEDEASTGKCPEAVLYEVGRFSFVELPASALGAELPWHQLWLRVLLATASVLLVAILLFGHLLSVGRTPTAPPADEGAPVDASKPLLRARVSSRIVWCVSAVGVLAAAYSFVATAPRTSHADASMVARLLLIPPAVFIAWALAAALLGSLLGRLGRAGGDDRPAGSTQELERDLSDERPLFLNRLFILVAIGVGAYLVVALGVERGPGEPSSWVEGVSISPTVLFRLLGAVVAVMGLAYAWRELAAEPSSLRRLPDLDRAGTGEPGGQLGTLLRWFIGRNDPATSFVESLGVLIIWLTAISTLFLVWPATSPARGAAAFWCDMLSTAAFIAPVSLLNFLIWRRILLCNRLIRRLPRAETIFAPNLVASTRLPAPLASSILDLQLIARITAMPRRLLYVPVVLLALHAIARSRLVDNWTLSLGYAIAIGLSFGLTIHSAAMLRGIAMEARNQELARLRELRGRTEFRAEDADRAIKEVQDYKEGPFAGLVHEPAAQALLITFVPVLLAWVLGSLAN